MRTILAFIVSMAIMPCTAQEVSESPVKEPGKKCLAESCFMAKKMKQLHGTISTQYTRVANRGALLLNMKKGKPILDDNLVVGFTVSCLKSDINPNVSDVILPAGMDASKIKMKAMYGGAYAEPVLGRDLPVQITVPVSASVGFAGYRDVYGAMRFADSPKDMFREKDFVFVGEAGINVETKIFEKVKVGAGVSYRYSSGTDLEFFDVENLNGFAAGLYLKHGLFK